MSISGTPSFKRQPKLMESCTIAFPAGRSRVIKEHVFNHSCLRFEDAQTIPGRFWSQVGHHLTLLRLSAGQTACGPWTKGALLVPCSAMQPESCHSESWPSKPVSVSRLHEMPTRKARMCLGAMLLAREPRCTSPRFICLSRRVPLDLMQASHAGSTWSLCATKIPLCTDKISIHIQRRLCAMVGCYFGVALTLYVDSANCKWQSAFLLPL